ncbi:MAG: ATP-binding protein [Gammaproteobacteria bacterium]|nr:ATP-binding protein [Gammaproteobacteria bacterium]
MGRLSLRARLLLVATCVLLIFLGLMGLVLDQAFRRSVEEGVSERLRLHIYGLLATAEESNGSLYLPENLQEPDFNRLGTGLYAVVFDGSGTELWRSSSALDLALSETADSTLRGNFSPGEPAFGRIEAAGDIPLFFLAYRVLWQGTGETVTPYTFVAMQTLDTYRSEVAGFRNNLWGWLGGVVFVLIGVQAAVMSWGLAPLRRLESDLGQIEAGEQDYLQGDYPVEIEGVTRNLNVLLASERQQREKYRTTLADLAHSLKTPLAILRGTAASMNGLPADPEKAVSELDSIRATVDEQVARMDEIVGYQLGRGMTSSPTIIRRSIDVRPLLDRLVAAMRKVYSNRDVELTVDAQECSFFGDERDLMEMLGNVVDNACKYCDHEVHIEVTQPIARGKLRLVIEDDGPGIPDKERELVMRRGERLDASAPGQGIGLAVVAELVARYGGDWDIEDSALGGARFVINLP